MSTVLINTWDQYVTDVLFGDVVVCKAVRQACERHQKDLARSVDPTFPYEFREDVAKRVISFFSKLRLTKGLPAPGRAFVPEPWQQFVLVSLFAWVSKKTGLRRFRSGHITVARKNGKSHLMAGMGDRKSV